jgi:hypothetical protein
MKRRGGVASHNAGRGDTLAMPVGKGQHRARFRPFSRRVSQPRSALLRQCMPAIPVHLPPGPLGRAAHDARLPHWFHTPISTPGAPMLSHRLPTRFAPNRAFLGSLRYRQTRPLATRMHPLPQQVEAPHQRPFAHAAAFGRRHLRQAIRFELVRPDPGREPAHDAPARARRVKPA